MWQKKGHDNCMQRAMKFRNALIGRPLMATARNTALVIDDDALYVRAVRRVLERNGYSVSAKRNCAETREFLAAHRAPDIVLLDLCLPDGNGETLLPLIASHVPPHKIAVVTGLVRAETWLRLEQRCRCVLPKPLDCLTLLQVAKTLSIPRNTSSCVERFASFFKLSSRETQVLRLAAFGLTNKEIPEALGFSQTTIRSYWQRIYSKTGYRSQREIFLGLLDFGLCDV